MVHLSPLIVKHDQGALFYEAGLLRLGSIGDRRVMPLNNFGVWGRAPVLLIHALASQERERGRRWNGLK
jgi:hypothetical protein